MLWIGVKDGGLGEIFCVKRPVPVSATAPCQLSWRGSTRTHGIGPLYPHESRNLISNIHNILDEAKYLFIQYTTRDKQTSDLEASQSKCTRWTMGGHTPRQKVRCYMSGLVHLSMGIRKVFVQGWMKFGHEGFLMGEREPLMANGV